MGQTFNLNEAVCEHHFQPKDILRNYSHQSSNFDNVKKRTILRKGAIPLSIDGINVQEKNNVPEDLDSTQNCEVNENENSSEDLIVTKVTIDIFVLSIFLLYN